MNDITRLSAEEFLFYQRAILEGMAAENAQRSHCGHSMAYTEDDFIDLAEKTREGFRAIID